MECYNIPHGRVLVREVFPERNGIILTTKPEYRRGEVVIGNDEIEVGEYVAFKANGDVVYLDGEEYRLIKSGVCIFTGTKEQVVNAKIKDAFNHIDKVYIKTV